MKWARGLCRRICIFCFQCTSRRRSEQATRIRFALNEESPKAKVFTRRVSRFFAFVGLYELQLLGCFLFFCAHARYIRSGADLTIRCAAESETENMLVRTFGPCRTVSVRNLIKHSHCRRSTNLSSTPDDISMYSFPCASGRNGIYYNIYIHGIIVFVR